MGKKIVNAEQQVALEHLVHGQHLRIALRFPYDVALIAAAKNMGAKWSSTHRCWHTPNSPEHLQAIFAAFKGLAWVDMNGLRKSPAPTQPARATAPSPEAKPSTNRASCLNGSSAPAPAQAGMPVSTLTAMHEDALAAMRRKLEIARYSPRSIQVYISATRRLFQHFPQKHPNDIRTEDIETFQHHLATVRKVSNSTLNQLVNAVRYYYMNVVGDAKRVTFIERPRKETKLPLVLSKAEIVAVLKAPTNLKHQAMLALAYSGG
ncbi:MAG: site-specific integrase, partial [Flavobacteriales bacterium]